MALDWQQRSSSEEEGLGWEIINTYKHYVIGKNNPLCNLNSQGFSLLILHGVLHAGVSAEMRRQRGAMEW